MRARRHVHQRSIDRQIDYLELYGDKAKVEEMDRLVSSANPLHEEPGQAYRREIDDVFDQLLDGKPYQDSLSTRTSTRERGVKRKEILDAQKEEIEAAIKRNRLM